jgi:hypothetical protein
MTEQQVGQRISYVKMLRRASVTLGDLSLDCEKSPACQYHDNAASDAAALRALATLVAEAERLEQNKATAKRWGAESDALIASLAAGFEPSRMSTGQLSHQPPHQEGIRT